MVLNGLKPIFFTLSARDFSGSLRFISKIHNLLSKKIGKRMGWVARKI